MVPDAACVVLVFNTQSEATLTSLKTKWMPQLQKQVSKTTVKHGLVLLGVSFTAEEDCSFQHKVALFTRGFQLSRVTYARCLKFTEDKAKLETLIKQALEKVAEANAKAAAGILPTESVADSASGLQSEPSIQKTLSLPPVPPLQTKESRYKEAPAEIEDIIKAASVTEPKKPEEPPKTEVKKQEEPPKIVEAKKSEPVVEKKVVADDDYDEDFE